ncbi:Co-chaperone protein HscB homolog [Thiomonas sp. X19]|uniref:Fe-S protein assembly co-chaperone HscB n=1 Tax=Thiomonas sp. X19 TaxID=1050370 RepID=UPI000B6DEC64|nr:Fe-S protein assembly co-chaperone HscB [Thiomonas sp. X19]SCC93216.1 Co-chaperone protein HscB homolog [Thiomonas sp. X19]
MPTAAMPQAQGHADFTQDHFTLFGLPQRFALDGAALTQAWRQIQAAVHPDRFAGASAAEKRLAMQWSTQVNTAYRTLKDPQLRAAYLCGLRGAAIHAERNTAMPTAFLMQQMQWREALDEARDAGDAAAIRDLLQTVEQARSQALAQLTVLLDGTSQDEQARAALEAAEQVRVLMFIDRFRQDLGPFAMRAASQAPHPAHPAHPAA